MKSRAAFLSDSSYKIRFIYTPRHASWINQIEIWFSILAKKLLKRMSYTSIEELKASIGRFIEQHNVTVHRSPGLTKGKRLRNNLGVRI
jgi:transposase